MGTAMHTLIRSQILRALVLCTTTALTTGGCYGWSAAGKPGDLVDREAEVERAIVTDTLGNTYEVEDITVSQGFWHGWLSESGQPVAFRDQEIRHVRVKDLQHVNTALLAFGITLGALSAVAAASISSSLSGWE